MDHVDNLKNILNHLVDIAVYVIRRDTHELLYFNDAVRKVTPGIAQGQFCHEVWAGTCGNCPLKTLGERETNTTTSYHDPFGKAVDVTASKIDWEGDIPAYIISATTHRQTAAEQELELERRRLAAVATRMYPLVISVNLTSNSYTMLEYKSFAFTTVPEAGNYEDLVQISAETIHPVYQKEYQAALNREELLERYRNGEREFVQEHKKMGPDGVYHWNEMNVVFVDNPFGTDIFVMIMIRNIDSQKAVECQLESSLQAICEASGGMTGKFLVKDQDVILLEASSEYLQFFKMGGLEKDHFAFSALSYEQAAYFTKLACEAGKNREVISLEIPYINGEELFWISVQASCIGEQNGWPVYFGTIVDITKKVQMELEYEVTYNSLPGGITKLILNDTISLVSANPAFYHMLGIREEEYGGEFLSYIDERDRNVVKNTMHSQLSHDIPILIEFRMHHRDGKEIWLHMDGKKIGEKDGYPLLLTVILDITERKRAQNALEEEQLKYRIAVENSNDILFEYDVAQDLFLVHENAAAVSGAKSSENVKLSIPNYRSSFYKNDIVHPDDIEKINDILERPQSQRIEIRLRKLATGIYTWYSCQLTVIQNQGEVSFLVGTLRDIDQIKHNEEKRLYWKKLCDFAISRDYQMILTIDINTGDSYCRYSADHSHFQQDERIGNFDQKIQQMIKTAVIWEAQSEAAEKLKLSYLIPWLRDGKEDHNLYYQFMSKEGSYRWKCISFSLFDLDPNTILMAVRDIEEVRTAKIQEEVARQSLELAMLQVYEEMFLENLTAERMDFTKSSGNFAIIDKICEPQFREFVQTCIHPDDQIDYQNAFSLENQIRAFQNGQKVISLEHRRLNKRGEYHWVLTSVVQSEPDLNGDLRAVGLVFGIDSRKQAERMQEEFLTSISTLFEECSIVNIEKDEYTLQKEKDTRDLMSKRGEFSTFNEVYCHSMIHPDDQELFRKYFSLEGLKRQLNQGKGQIIKEMRRMGADGTYHWAEMIAVPIQNQIGRDRKVVCTYRDIDDLKREREKRQNAELRFSGLVTRLYDFIYEGDLCSDESYMWLNDGEGLKRVPIEHSLSEGLERAGETVIHPDYQEAFRNTIQAPALLKTFQEGRHSVYFEVPRKMREGRYHWHSIEIQLLTQTADSVRVAIYLKDIDQSRRAEEEKRQALQDALSVAERANHSKSEFLSRMSHDIRTPLNAIVGMTEIASIQAQDANKVRECMEKISISSQYLISLINDILDMSKIESGKMVLATEPFCFGEWIESLSAVWTAQAEQKNQSFLLSIEPGIVESYIGDILRLNQILMNLISNAMKYTPKGGKIHLSVFVKADEKQYQQVCFEVEDNGVGMSEEFINRMYDPFEQAENSGGRIREGTGLGLSITRNLVRLMDGKIEVESKLGRGTRFAVTIRLEKSISTDESHCGEIKQVTEQGQKIDSARFHGERILLVEDNELNLEIAKTLLELQGAVIDTARNGQEAIDAFVGAQEGYYRAILMDIRMPVLDGLEATKQIRAFNRGDARTVPILAMTANAFHEEMDYAARCGMTDYLTKPIDLDKLFTKLKSYL
jgi:PAS domain S-box-containing protein